MSSHRIGSDLVRPVRLLGARRAGAGTSEGVEETADIRRLDRIDISAEGRELSATYIDEAEMETESVLEQVRDRINDGFYNEQLVASELAYRLYTGGVVDVTR